MTVEENFAKLSARMIEGLMFHDQMSDYYAFLNLEGYSKCHEYHYWCESKSYVCLKQHYIKHHGKLIKETPLTNPNVISPSWYNYFKEDVDINTKRNSVKTGLEKWMKWEMATKSLYEEVYKDLVNNGAISDAIFVTKFIEDVDCELAHIKKCYIEKQDTDFNIGAIISEQKPKKEKYEKKMG